MADVFSENFQADPPIEVTFNDLVGEGQKYSDPDQLAKAYAHIESHAKKLEAENARIRAERDVNDATNNNRQDPAPNGQEPLQNQQDQQNSEAPNNSPSPGSDVDFRSQIKEEIRALNEEERAQVNMDAAARKMVEVFGSEQAAAEAIRKRAQELDVSVEWLRDSAKRSPNAFYASMGITAGGGSHSTPSPNPEVRLGNTQNVKNFEFFDKLRKDNPKLYYSADNQREMMNEARKQGSAFYQR